MQVAVSYLGSSGARADGSIRLCPDLGREPVAFDGALRDPLRFREAISALHDVVINDLRFKPRDKTAYQAWKKAERERLRAVRQHAHAEAKAEVLARRSDVPPDIEARFQTARNRYWAARRAYGTYLLKHDYELWRQLMPYDPVVTVAHDVVFFECFSADESSYGCLTVDRDAFGAGDAQLGTTNVDYSWDLFDALQKLRTYRSTRLHVDPEGFEVRTEGHPDYREEKIDIPPGWLRGFMQVQAAMGLPMRRVSLDRASVYSLLAFLRRNRARTSPRAIRFELLPGQAPTLVVEPTETRITSHGTTYDGPAGAPIRTWGRRRLLVLARLLPLIERVDVYLLGTGLPSFWVARMGDMRLTLGLSGWTTNDWTRGSALDLLAPPAEPSDDLIRKVARELQEVRAASFAELERGALVGSPELAAALDRLAHTGQVIHDLDAGVYRWRQILPMALGEAQLGPEPVEPAAARELVPTVELLPVRVEDDGRTWVRGRIPGAWSGAGKDLELLLDRDGRMLRGDCSCSHHFKNKLRMGPCRHLLALRTRHLEGGERAGSLRAWFDGLRRTAVGPVS